MGQATETIMGRFLFVSKTLETVRFTPREETPAQQQQARNQVCVLNT